MAALVSLTAGFEVVLEIDRRSSRDQCALRDDDIVQVLTCQRFLQLIRLRKKWWRQDMC